MTSFGTAWIGRYSRRSLEYSPSNAPSPAAHSPEAVNSPADPWRNARSGRLRRRRPPGTARFRPRTGNPRTAPASALSNIRFSPYAVTAGIFFKLELAPWQPFAGPNRVYHTSAAGEFGSIPNARAGFL